MNDLNPSRENANRNAGRLAACLPVAVGPVLYGVGLWAASCMDHCPPGRTACFDPALADHFALLRLLAAVTMAIGALLVVFVVPWWLAALAVGRIESRRATAGLYAVGIYNNKILAVVKTRVKITSITKTIIWRIKLTYFVDLIIFTVK